MIGGDGFAEPFSLLFAFDSGVGVGSDIGQGAEALAGGAPAMRAVVGEEAGVKFIEGATGLGAMEFGAEDGGLVLSIEEVEGAFAEFESSAENGVGAVGFDVSKQGVDGVFPVAVESLEGGGLNPGTVHAEERDGFFAGPAGDFGVIAFAGFDEGSEEGEGAPLTQEGTGLLEDSGGGLADGGFSGGGIVKLTDFGVEEAKELVQFGDGGDGGF